MRQQTNSVPSKREKWLGSVVTKYGDITELLRKTKGCTLISVGMKTEWTNTWERHRVALGVSQRDPQSTVDKGEESAQSQAHLDKAKVELESLSSSTEAFNTLIKSLDPDRKPTPKAKSKPT